MDIAAWLVGLGLERYRQAFDENDVDGEVLLQLTGDDLKDIGVASVGHRKKLLEAIASLNAASGSAAASLAPLPVDAAKQPDAERRQLTVMFTDLVGSTALSAKLDPEDMREIIRVYQNTVAGEITRFEGHVAKFMGDGVLAYFGWPKAHEDEAERAVRAGLAVVRAMGRLQTPDRTALQARIGIATGLVVVGDLAGEGAAQEQAVVGDTPNLAARLQSAAGPGTVVIAEATRRLLGDVFVLRDLGAQTLKGIQEPTAAFAVLDERTLETRFAARHGGGLAPIVGRDQELGFMSERWRQARSGEGQVVLLTGEAGIGKSRITEALIEASAGDPHFLLRYQCSPYNTDSALYPVIQHLTFAAGFAAEDSTERRLERLESLLARGSDDIGEAAPLVAAILGIDGEARYGASALTPQQRRNRTLAVLIDQLAGLAERRPVLWVIEDAHWIDPTTLELIELALDRVQGIGVLMLITARPTFVASFASHPVVTRLALNRLARAATQAIVLRITRGKRLPDDLLEEIAARTDGVPLFVEEMTKAVIESGMLHEENDAYCLEGPLSALAIPTTLHDSLMARLDRLQPVKEVAQTAAVIGRSFDYRSIAALAAMPEADLTEAMRKLVEAELVFRRGVPPDASYLFKHALVRDAAYESMLKSRRQLLHMRLLGILEVSGAARPEILAQHAQAGGDAERAIGWWHEAAEAAVGRAAFAEAEAHLASALALLPALHDVPKRRRAEAAIAITHSQLSLVRYGYGHERTKTLYARADALARDADDQRLFMLARYGVWAVYHVRENVGPALVVAKEMREETTRRGDPQLSMMALRMLGDSQTMAGRLTEARETLGTARSLYDHERDKSLSAVTGADPIVSINSYLAFAELALGFPDRARALAGEAWDVVQASGEVHTKAHAIWHRAALASLAGEAARSRELALEVTSETRLRGLQFWQAMARIVAGWAMFATGDPAGAADALPRLIEEVEATGSGLFGALSRSVLAEAQAAIGDVLAFETIAASEELARRSGAFYELAEIQRREGVIRRRLRPGDGAGAEAAFRRALATAKSQDARFWELRAARDLARLLVERGERRQAADLLTPIYDWFTEGFDLSDLRETKELLDELRI
ncbi:AAA family ATPase [Mesorhizobium sp. L-8-3]|uniref:AAA family ATPase n=1 Tax=Mesorhizobium sp. L-8-3 TaxID=2744522 RepID=UPI001927C878|nr:adenylate/guanylate cyclase domain-containing protein [Mesorhizobium sp. L-8-3]BCH27233.1 adenylate cyclase [Mesorhizobium sp. L-8-3]